MYIISEFNGKEFVDLARVYKGQSLQKALYTLKFNPELTIVREMATKTQRTFIPKLKRGVITLEKNTRPPYHYYKTFGVKARRRITSNK